MLVNNRPGEPVAVGLLLATLVAFVVVAAADGEGFVQDADDAFLRGMEGNRHDALVWLAKALSVAGGVWVNWPVRVLVMVVLMARRRWLQLAAFVLAVATSELLTGTLKDLYGRPRPSGSLIVASGWSFPSGHAVVGAVTVVGAVVALVSPGPRCWAWELAACLFAVVMALSRTYLSAHWLSDVVGGLLMGLTLAVGWPALLQQLESRRQAAAVQSSYSR